jgi:hypothetical protein
MYRSTVANVFFSACFCVVTVCVVAGSSAEAQSDGGTDATRCLTLEANSYGTAILQNNCAETVSAAWCVESPYTKCSRYNNMIDIAAGSSYPVGGKGYTHWAACRGKDTIKPNPDSLRFGCRPD